MLCKQLPAVFIVVSAVRYREILLPIELVDAQFGKVVNHRYVVSLCRFCNRFIVLDQRLAEMRNSTTKVKTPPPRNNGRTEKRPQDWEKLLNAGYKPGPTNQGLDASEEARCLALIRQAFYSKWDRPAWTSSLKKMCLSVRFGAGGKVIGYSLTQSSGDASADRTVLRAASQVGYVRGLTSAFLEKNKTVIVRFEVTPE